MGIYAALSTAVSGLRAQSFALENISGNIANSQTIGFKRIETSFVDLIPDVPMQRQTPGAVLAQSRSTNNVQGDVNASATETYMALNGSGFFVVEPSIGETDGQTEFAGANYFTRRGDFTLDKNGHLVNGAGYFLKGLPIDQSTGNVSGSVPEVITVSNDFLAAQRTTEIDYRLNLPQLPKNPSYEVGVVGSELLDDADYANDPTTDGVIRADNENQFLEDSISGGAITVYASNGAPVDVQLRWAKIDSIESGGSDTWNLYYLSDSSAAGATTKWTSVAATLPATGPQDYTFNSAGTNTPPIASSNIANLTINGVSVGAVSLQHGTNGISQFNDPNGTADVSMLGQNGYAAGEFVSVAINDKGRVVASYSNNKQVELAQVVTATFNGAEWLKRQDGGVFAATSESGEPIIGTDGAITGAALESSNTDISEEFTKLIVTQQAYAAGTRIVSTADEMLQESLNMIR